MLRVGLTGGLGSGKTFVGKTLASLGCRLIQADQLGHQVLMEGGAAYEPVIREFGPEICDEKGAIDRRKLAAIVFDTPERLQKLSSFVHPAVFQLEEQMMSDIARGEPDAIAVVEAAILVETGSYKRFDRLIVAFCRPEQQIERAMKRDELTREEVLARLSRQLPLEEKVRVADYIVDTSGTKEETVEQTKAAYQSLRSLKK